MYLEYLLVQGILLNLKNKTHSVRYSGIHLRNTLSVIIILTNPEYSRSTGLRLLNAVPNRDLILTMNMLKRNWLELNLLDIILCYLLEYKNTKYQVVLIPLSILMRSIQQRVTQMISKD